MLSTPPSTLNRPAEPFAGEFDAGNLLVFDISTVLLDTERYVVKNWKDLPPVWHVRTEVGEYEKRLGAQEMREGALRLTARLTAAYKYASGSVELYKQFATDLKGLSDQEKLTTQQMLLRGTTYAGYCLDINAAGLDTPSFTTRANAQKLDLQLKTAAVMALLV